MINDDRLELKQKFLSYYKELPIQKLAAEFIGRVEETIIAWKKEDIDFLNQMSEAKSNWALTNSKRVRSKEWLLERVMNDHFGNKIDITSGGKPLPILGGITKEKDV